MYYVTATLRNGTTLSGVLNARSELDAVRQVRAADTDNEVRSVVAVRGW